MLELTKKMILKGSSFYLNLYKLSEKLSIKL